MAQEQKSNKYSIQTHEQNVREGLYQLYSISIKPCEYLGFTIFSLKPNAELHFNSRSLAFILLILRHISVLMDVIIFQSSAHLFEAIYPDQSDTEKFTKKILATTTITGDILYTIFLYMNRDEILRFHKEQIEFVVEAIDPLTENDKSFVLSAIPFALRILRRYRRIIFGAFYYGAISSTVMFINAVLKSEKSVGEMGYGVYTMPIFYITWTATSYLRLLQRLVMITLFHGFRSDAFIINLQLRELIKGLEVEAEQTSELEMTWHWQSEFGEKSGNKSNERVKRILEFIKKLEEVIAGANLVFGWCNPLDMLMMLVTITTSLFPFIVFLLQSEFSGALTFGLPLALNMAILFEFCNAAYGFETEAKQCAKLMRLIPMSNLSQFEAFQISLQHAKLLLEPLTIIPASFFHVNRKTLTAIAGAITTYLVVLVQFNNE